MTDRNPTDHGMSLASGTTVGRYTITGRIGAGGMGEVYRAEDESLKRTVALKFLLPELSRTPEYRDRFMQEARAAARLDHPNIVTVHEVGEYEGVPYCVMSYVDGLSLAERKAVRVIPISRIIEYGIQVAEGIAAAHDGGITHRDLKPGNIIVSDAGSVYIVDFGLAVVADVEAGDDAEATVTRLTAAGAPAGTVPYMSPEQLQAGPIGPHVDIFALGVTLYELTCGVHPFAAESPAETAAGILRDEPADVQTHRPDAPYDLKRIIHRCLRKEPSRRFQSARDVRNELLDLQELMKDTGYDAHEQAAPGSPRQSLEEKGFTLTAEMVRELEAKSPKMIGDQLVYLDNRRDSDVLVIYMHAWGLDHRHTADFLASLPYRCVAPTLYGFDYNSRHRLPLSLEDQSKLLRKLFAHIYQTIRPKHVVVMGFSSGADHALHLLTSDIDPGLPVSGLVSFGCNVSLESCFLSARFAELSGSNPEELLEDMKRIGNSTQSVGEWLKFHEYMVDVFSKFGDNVDPLRALGKGIVAPFRERDWRQFAAWYRTMTERYDHVRFVIDRDDFDRIDFILEQHLEENVLGDNFREDSIIKENISHIELASVEIAMKHTTGVVEEIQAG